MNDFLVFRRMVSPLIIQAIFWIGVVASVIAGLIGIGNSFGEGQANTKILEALLGVAVLLGGPMITRIFCELLILLFRMNETLSDIRSSLIGSHE